MQNDNTMLLLSELLTREEGPTLDFKEKDYSLKGEEEKSKFIKDILSLANTPRAGDAHIVIGVRKTSGAPPQAVGIERHRDDTDYQHLIKEWIQPTPELHYIPATHEEKKIGILRITPRKGPYKATKDMGSLHAGVLYARTGSSNTAITTPTDEARIIGWHTMPPEIEHHAEDWQRFVDYSRITENDRLLILATGPLSPPSLDRIRGVADAPWFAIIDLDHASNETGLLQRIGSHLENHRRIHPLVINESFTVNVGHATYWYLARGSQSRASTFCADKYTDWVRMYGRDMASKMRHLADNSGVRPATLVLLAEQNDLLHRLKYFIKIMDAAIEAFGERVRFALCAATEIPDDLVNQYQEMIATFALSPDDIARGIERELSSDRQHLEIRPWEIPGRSGVPALIPPRDRPWLLEELDIAHSLCGINDDPNQDSREEFLRGAQIQWPQLAIDDDVKRDIFPKIIKNLRVDLGVDNRQSSRPLRYSIYHEPGAGGTTLGRRILWSLRSDVPAVMIRKCTPTETIERIRHIHNLSSLPVLALIEAHDVSERNRDALYTELKAQQVPCIIVQVIRVFMHKKKTEGDQHTRAHTLDAQLSNVEAALFAEQYARIRPHKRQELLDLAKAPGPQRQAFFFGLTAFEDRFSGLTSYVAERIKATDEQRKVMTFISLAYHYGHLGISEQMFARHLGMPRSQRVDLEEIIPQDARVLFQREGTTWRPAHDLIAAEIIRQVLNPANSDPRVWTQNLAQWSKDFATFCSEASDHPSQDITDIVRNCYLWRESQDLTGREDAATHSTYSRLLTDIPSTEDRLSVLKHLVDAFPEDAHIWAHLGRFAYREKTGDDAVMYIDRAIQLAPDDFVLYHIKGMALRSLAKDELTKWKDRKTDDALQNAISLIQQAGEQFEMSRRYNNQNEHGYISHIQMLLNLVDTARAVYKRKSLHEIAALGHCNVFIREALDQAEGLLDLVRFMRGGEKESEYILRVSADLDALYGNHEKALQTWDSLLSRNGVYRPTIRRQIVRSYFSRSGRAWHKIGQDNIRRIIDLLEANMLEEPSDDRNIRLWIQAVRQAIPPRNIDSLIARVTYWKTNSTSIDAAYYLYVLHTLSALEGSMTSGLRAMEALDECKKRSRLQRSRNHSFEWLGHGPGIHRLVHQSELGDWDRASDFWGNGAQRLARIKGWVRSIRRPESGDIELDGGVIAFFNPGRASMVRGRDENTEVTLFLGFTYDGPRAWEVRALDATTDRGSV